MSSVLPPPTGGTGGDTTPPPPPPPTTSTATAAYTALASASTVQVLSPTLVIDAVVVTIQSSPSGVIASITLAADILSSSAGDPVLASFAGDLETIATDQRVLEVTGTQAIDDSGLLLDAVDITVGYTPPGSILPPLTMSVVVPFSTAGGYTGSPIGTGTASAVELGIADAYQKLITLAGG